MATKQGEPEVTITATKGFVSKILQDNFQELKGIFSSTAMDQVKSASVPNNSSFMNSEDFLQNNSQTDTTSASQAKDLGSTSTNKIDMSSPRAEMQLSRRYGIKNIQKHVLDQIRFNVDKTGKEAKIQLRPPELGEIKIHILMEDQRVMVRMEVSEQLVKSMLERDIQQLKNALHEAGIDMDDFDISSKGDKPNKDSTDFFRNGDKPNLNSETEDNRSTKDMSRTESGAVRIDSGDAGVDYLVY